jgi:MAF protein
MHLILASTSPYRAELLARLGVPFSTESPATDESPLPAETPHDLVYRLAQRKAEAVAEHHDRALIIGSDQIAVLDEQILGKPGTAELARAQLALLSAREVSFMTGLCVLNTADGSLEVTVVETPVRFRQLSETQIAHYVEREMPLDCAGGFKSEGLGIALFEAIGGSDPSALIGLPLIELCAMLSRHGMDVLG